MNVEFITKKQEKERGVVIVNCSKQLEKCLSILQGKQLIKLYDDLANKLQIKVQGALRKTESKLQVTKTVC